MHQATRVLIEQNPFATQPGAAGRWLRCAGVGAPPFVTAYRRRFRMSRNGTIRIHVTADERYELFLDGQQIGRGSERGDANNWYFESYDLTLPKGEHVLVARVWSLGKLAALAQMSVVPGFLLAAGGPYHKLLSTGFALWEAKQLDGCGFDGAQLYGNHFFAVEPRVVIDGSRFPWGFETGAGEGWQTATDDLRVIPELRAFGIQSQHYLKPATLPPMLDRVAAVGQVVFIGQPPSGDVRALAVKKSNHFPGESTVWSALLRGKGSITIEPNTIRRVIIDLENYYCGYTSLITTAGEGSRIRVSWSESLYADIQAQTKGNRDEIDDKYFYGLGDVFQPDGGAQRRFEPLWWNAGRFIEILIETRDAPLTIEEFALRETRYPLEAESAFAASDARLERIVPIAVRGLQMCSHETYMDCPFFEQLMYVGDTRLEALTTFVLTRDDRLPRKALRLFDASRWPNGLTQARYPCNTPQIIAPFSLWWVAMVHDYALWRGDLEFIRSLMPGVRAVIEAFLSFFDARGLITGPPGWNFMDWVPAWERGIPPNGEFGTSALINWQLALVLKQAAALEEWMGEPALAARDHLLAAQLAERLTTPFWDERRGLFADDLHKKHFSEHTQCLALLSGLLPPETAQKVASGLLADRHLERTTIYFTHYLFETYRQLGAMKALQKRLGLWFELEKQGSKTTVEMPEPTRSDCHGWGAHPLFHYYATILGIRPASMGFGTVRVDPQLGDLKWARGNLVHPRGMIAADFQIRNKRLCGSVSLPPGVTGSLIYQGSTLTLRSGRQTIEVSA